MSSSRKRAAVQKANNRAEFLEQKLMMTEYHLSCIKLLAEVAAMKHDEKQLEIFELKLKYCPDEMTEEDKKLYEVLKQRVNDTKLKIQGVTNEKPSTDSTVSV